MKITFLAHASFLIVTKNGTKIITDPYKTQCFGGALGYKPIKELADIVLISHEHDDHNGISDISGKPQVIKGAGNWAVKDIKIFGIRTYHDTQKGVARGQNIIYIIEADGLRIAHLGDLGHALSKEQIAQIGPIDILLSPVGGHFTIDPQIASEIFITLNPRIMIPMHYKTRVLNFPIVAVEEFIKDKKDVKTINNSEIEISKESLPKIPEIWVLKMAKE